MPAVILSILPIIGMFVLGVALRQLHVFAKEDGERFLKVVVYVGLPALIVLSVGRAKLDPAFALLPFAAVLTIICTFPFVRFFGAVFRLPRQALGVFVVGPMIMNMAALYPFVLAAWGPAGFARLVAFDVGNALLVLTLVYALAGYYGAKQRGVMQMLRRLVTFPPLVALAVALVVNLADVVLPEVLVRFLEVAGNLMMPLLMLALGNFFEPKLVRAGPLVTAMALRAGLGFGLGLLWVALFDLQGMNRAVVLLGTMAPVGFNTLVFANQEGLDREFAASLASTSLLLGMVYVPVGCIGWGRFFQRMISLSRRLKGILIGDSPPKASYFLCAPKESNQRKGARTLVQYELKSNSYWILCALRAARGFVDRPSLA